MSFENIIVEKKDAVGVITLNRPKALNALSAALTKELETALIELDGDNSIGCMVITGSEKGCERWIVDDRNLVEEFQLVKGAGR